jgi:hypothetical protein
MIDKLLKDYIFVGISIGLLSSLFMNFSHLVFFIFLFSLLNIDYMRSKLTVFTVALLFFTNTLYLIYKTKLKWLSTMCCLLIIFLVVVL